MCTSGLNGLIALLAQPAEGVHREAELKAVDFAYRTVGCFHLQLRHNPVFRRSDRNLLHALSVWDSRIATLEGWDLQAALYSQRILGATDPKYSEV